MTSDLAIPGLNSHTLPVGHRRIHFSEIGRGEPMLLLHGGGPGAAGVPTYARNIEALARDFRVLVPDLPGYGQSSKGIRRADPFGDLAESMLGLLDVLGVASAHVVGNSYGGACALRMALDQPKRVTSLVLMGPGGINTTRGLPTAGLNCLLGYYSGSGPSIEKLRTFIHQYLVYDPSQVSEAAVRARYASSIDPEVIAQPPLRRPNSLAAALRMDFTRDVRLRTCRTPTLVLWGTEDKVNRPSGGATLQRTMPSCDLHLFSRTGHWVQWERAEEFNALTAAFGQRHSTLPT